MTPLFKSSERVCLDTAPDVIKREPFGPYMKCVEGTCECKAAAKDKPFDPHFDGKMASGWR